MTALPPAAGQVYGGDASGIRGVAEGGRPATFSPDPWYLPGTSDATGWEVATGGAIQTPLIRVCTGHHVSLLKESERRLVDGGGRGVRYPRA